jgi:hypothetical protein
MFCTAEKKSVIKNMHYFLRLTEKIVQTLSTPFPTRTLSSLYPNQTLSTPYPPNQNPQYTISNPSSYSAMYGMAIPNPSSLHTIPPCTSNLPTPQLHDRSELANYTPLEHPRFQKIPHTGHGSIE